MTLLPAIRPLALIVFALCVHRVECQVPAARTSEGARESAWQEDWDSAMASAQQRGCAILVLFEGGSPATSAWAGWDEPRVTEELRTHVITVRIKRYAPIPALSPSDQRMIRVLSPDAESVIRWRSKNALLLSKPRRSGSASPWVSPSEVLRSLQCLTADLLRRSTWSAGTFSV